MDIRRHSSKIVGLAVAITALSLSFGGWALASHSAYNKAGHDIVSPTTNPDTSTDNTQGNQGNIDRQPAQIGADNMPEGGTVYGDDIYKVENGTVYEYDDGWWKPKLDKKIENGVVYDFDDGRWEVEYDPTTFQAPASQNAVPQAAPKAQNNNVQQNNTAPKAQNNAAPKTNTAPQVAPAAPAQNNVAPQTNTIPNSKYKVENGTVYEWDDGRWKAEYDKKSENGVIYEYDDGRWEVDDDAWDDDWDD
ncbi:MAG: hypothetical protein IKS49_06260 [Actinomycetaceae bacterium]|nr:hypothetical protein [Actinomycetaceae bacterium]